MPVHIHARVTEAQFEDQTQSASGNLATVVELTRENTAHYEFFVDFE